MTSRRAFVALLALAALPEGLAQSKAARIGVLELGAESSFPARNAAFRDGLREQGLREGREIVLVQRWANGSMDELARLAAELVALPVDILFAPTTVSALAARKASRTVPIVFAVPSDPVGVKLVDSLARPAGNATGLTTLNIEVVPKRLEILKELSGAKSVGVLYNPEDPSNVIFADSAEEAARVLGVALRRLPVARPGEIEAAFKAEVGAMMVAAGAMMDGQRAPIARLAARSRMPALYGAREFVVAGGLVSYSASFDDNYRRAASYVARILKGAKPAELPVEQASKFDFVINLNAARALGLKIAPAMLMRASEVIE